MLIITYHSPKNHYNLGYLITQTELSFKECQYKLLDYLLVIGYFDQKYSFRMRVFNAITCI